MTANNETLSLRPTVVLPQVRPWCMLSLQKHITETCSTRSNVVEDLDPAESTSCIGIMQACQTVAVRFSQRIVFRPRANTLVDRIPLTTPILRDQ